MPIDLVRVVLPPAEQARIKAYRVQDCGMGTDVFGAKAEDIQTAYALGYLLHEYYFRVRSAGHEHIPHRGSGVIVGNHSGVLPFDGMMVATDIFRYTDPPRLVHYMVDYFVYRIPFLGSFFRALGQVPGTRRNFDGLIEHGHLVGAFPEGVSALGKLPGRRYELYPFSHGPVELAARHGAPVVPFGLVGAEEQQTMIADFKGLAKLLRLPYFPITKTFPWLGPFGLLPKPVRYIIHYGAPIEIDRLALSRIDVRQREVDRVREAVGILIERGLNEREKGQARSDD